MADAGGRAGPAALATMTPEERTAFQTRQRTFWKDEGVLLTLTATLAAKAEPCSAAARPRTGRSHQNPPQVSVTAENYNRIARLVEHDVPVKLSFDIKNRFTDRHRFV